MPQYLTLTIGAKVEKGSEIKSEAKFEVANAFALIDETICKCSSNTPAFEVPQFKQPLQIIITADKYYVDKDCVPNTLNCVPRKYIRFELLMDNTPVYSDKLQRPQILEIKDKPFNAIRFTNDLTIDVKVSVLIFRPQSDPCPTPTQQQQQQQKKKDKDKSAGYLEPEPEFEAAMQ